MLSHTLIPGVVRPEFPAPARRDRIEAITAEETALLSKWADYWIALGSSTVPADRAAFEEAAKKCYEFAGIPWPGPVVWVGSPMEGGRVAAAVSGAAALNTDWNAALTAALTRAPEAASMIKKGVWSEYLGGRLWLPWSAALTAYTEVLGLDLKGDAQDRLDAYATSAINCCCWWPRREVVIASEVPSVWHTEQVRPRGWGSHRLHCSTGPALAWANGDEIYAWHGTVVPGEWIKNPAGIDPMKALQEPNIELRRAAAEILGWDKVLDKLSPVVLDTDANPQIGVLLEVDLPEAPKSRFLRVQCGTGRMFVIPVPQGMKTAREANAATYGKEPGEYDPEIRT